MAARPLQHLDAEKKDDDTLRAEARAHLAESPSLQLVAELLAKLRAADLKFWSPEVLRERWSAAERMRWKSSRSAPTSGGPAVACSTRRGSFCTPPMSTSKCRCGPVARPVMPT